VERLGALTELAFLNVFHGVFDIAWRGHPGGSLYICLRDQLVNGLDVVGRQVADRLRVLAHC
jgi:hypothetical protein